MKTSAKIAIVVAGVVSAVLWKGYVLHVLWRWFVAPLGVPEIGVLQAIGLVLVVGTFREALRRDGDKIDDTKEALTRLGTWFVGSLLALLVGYILKSAMVP